ncbi:DegT/DnrJ/EryC1/StrS family aminotransferase [Planctomycetota bacterium]
MTERRYIANIPGINPDLLSPVDNWNSVPSWLPAERTKIVPCGRNALYLGWKASGVPEGTGVLIPSFVCTTVSRPLAGAGADLVFFRIRENGTIDWDDVQRNMNDSVKAFVWYHYLGCSYEFEEVIDFCRTHNLLLIEDCAHALFARYKEKPVGTFGDFSVFSIRKSIPALYSAAVVLNNPEFSFRNVPEEQVLPPKHAAYLKEREIFLYRQYLQSIDSTKKVDYIPYREHAKKMEPFFRDDTFLYEVDRTSMLVMHNIDPETVRRNRHRNFTILLDHLHEIALFDYITPGAAPIGFPVIINGRDDFRMRLEKEGVESLIHWPDYLLPEGIAEKYPETRSLADTVLSLPCHHDMSVEDTEYVCETVKRLLL